jgi:hypothetical protein
MRLMGEGTPDAFSGSGGDEYARIGQTCLPPLTIPLYARNCSLF